MDFITKNLGSIQASILPIVILDAIFTVKKVQNITGQGGVDLELLCRCWSLVLEEFQYPMFSQK